MAGCIIIGRIERMNPFVDYQKRGIELPEGCKDLIDVLQLARATAEQPPEQQPEPPREGLPGIEHFIIRMLASTARSRSLWIDGDRAAMIALFCNKRGLQTFILVDAAREQ